MTETVPQRRSAVPLLIAIAASIVAVVAIGFAVYVATIRQPTDQYLAQKIESDLRMTGLTTPVVNQLAPSFKDADGDLVADAPTDSSKLTDPPSLEFSYVATDDPSAFQKAFAEFCDHLSKATGKPVHYHSFTTSADELKAMHDGNLQIAGFNTGSVPPAVDLSGFVPMSMLGNGAKGGYQMEIIVTPDSEIMAVDQLKGHELALTEPNSNSGYKAPLVILAKQHDLLPGRDFGIRYTGSQDLSIDGIAKKTYEAAAVASDVLSRAIANGVISKDKFRVIFTSDTFPTAAIGYVNTLKPELAAKIKAATFDFSWKGTGLETEFAPGGNANFIPVDYKKDWEIVRKIDDAIGSKYVLAAQDQPTTQPMK